MYPLSYCPGPRGARTHLALRTWLCGLLLASLVACGDDDSPSTPSDAGVDAAVAAGKLDSIAPKRGPEAGGATFAISGEGFAGEMVVLFDGVPASDVRVVSKTLLTGVTPAGSGDVAVSVRDEDGTALDGDLEYAYLSPSDTSALRVLGAVSTGNTGLRVTFSKALGESADDASNYRITEVDGSALGLRVQSAKRGKSGTSVDLTTSSQNEVKYELVVADIKDAEGGELSPQELLVDPTRATFLGTPPGPDTLADSDGDGLFDNVEQQGWPVSVTLGNGDVVQAIISSDPFEADTDGDGMDDADELSWGTNPRDTDTDGDGVPDIEEAYTWRSDPTAQDTDEDGYSDAEELIFDTSPVLADTDGDGMNDFEELQENARDPRISDLPVPQILVAEYSLSMDVTSSYTDSSGTTRATQSSVSNTFAQGTSSSLSTSDTRSTEYQNKGAYTSGGEIGYEDGVVGKVSFSATIERARSRGFTSGVERQEAQEAQEQYEQSLAEAMETSQNQSITREITAASLMANVNLANQSAVPFTLQNIEISVQYQDRASDGAFRPVATLRPSGDPDRAFNLGPLDPARGPIIFENAEIFPNVVDKLMREPTGLLFKVANFDVLDEEGRNFVYSSAEVNSRTAGVTVDYGDGTVENYRVATFSEYDDSGRPKGITMLRALQLIGLTHAENDEEVSELSEKRKRTSFGTRTDNNGVERLVRVRGVQTDLSEDPKRKFWVVRTANPDADDTVDFTALALKAGDEYVISYTRDVDEDGLFELEEMLYGSSDTSKDTDQDGIPDYDEVRIGWTVSAIPGRPYKVFPSPAATDSDGDGLLDGEEMEWGTDPNRRDTDADGRSDYDELTRTETYPAASDPTGSRMRTLQPYVSVHIASNSRTATPAEGDDVQVATTWSSQSTSFLWYVAVTPGPNGVLDTTPSGGDLVAVGEAIGPGPDGSCAAKAASPGNITDARVSLPATGFCYQNVLGDLVMQPQGDDELFVNHLRRYATDPLNQDTDQDGVPDGREVTLGTNPNSKDAASITDSDGDGLSDEDELNGWIVTVDGVSSKRTSDAYRADTDGDGMPDLLEWHLRTNPRHVDSDGDGLSDAREFKVNNADNAQAAIMGRCAAAPNCTPPASGDSISNPLLSDSDGDTLSDGQEVDLGWDVVIGSNAPVRMYSNPMAANSDGDAWDDAQEKQEGTNPRSEDTDGDQAVDSDEAALGLLPLRPDKKVSIKAPFSVVATGNCALGTIKPNFEGYMTLKVPGKNQYNSFNFSACDGQPDGGKCMADGEIIYESFVMTEADTFTIGFVSVVEKSGTNATLTETSNNPLTFSYADIDAYNHAPNNSTDVSYQLEGNLSSQSNPCRIDVTTRTVVNR